MAIERYLAMTAAEITSCGALPDRLGYMACHFSPYGTGLSGCPSGLPEGAMLIVNDRISLRGHDPGRILFQLRELTEKFHCGSVLLDFERRVSREAADLAELLAEELACPVGVSATYAQDLLCPVFLPPVPCDTPPEDYLAPWAGREIWLEAGLVGMGITLTPEGAHLSPPFICAQNHPVHHDGRLHCHYQILTADSARFSFHRRPEDLDALLEEAEALGVTRAIGLYQELRGLWT